MIGGSFASPVPPGSGWPQDPADAATPVATSRAEVERLAATAGDVADLDARVSVCRACPRLVAWREQVAGTKRAAYADQPYWGRPAPSLGAGDARFLVVGLAPAAHGANRTGRMFTGDRSGDWIFAALHRAGLASRPDSTAAGDGLALLETRMVPAVHCAPPDNAPTPAERTTCAPWLDRDLALLAPTLEAVLALGGIAWDAIVAALRRAGWDVPRPKPRFGHGVVVELTRPDDRLDDRRTVRLVGCYHVSQQNTFTGRLTQQMLDDAIALLRP